MISLSKFLTIMHVGIKRKKLIIKVPMNSVILNVLWCLYKNGYISGYNIDNNYINIFLKYYQGQSILIIMKQISKISCRIYFQYNNILNEKKLNNNFILTTSKGIMLTEKKKKVGGEVLFKIK